MPLPDIDKTFLRPIADNPQTIDALKRLFYSTLLKTRMDGLTTVENAFQQLAQYKTAPDNPTAFNPAR